MIDLSYLTEEEQQMIMTVMQRDAELKKAEKERVRQLQKIPADKGKLKYLTGEWFYEAKSQRHRDRIDGSDIIRASMSPANPLSLLAMTKSWAARSRVASDGNRDGLSAPEHSEQCEEPPKLPQDERETDSASPSLKREGSRLAKRSSSKRHNPFNRPPLPFLDTPGDAEGQLHNGAVDAQGTAAGESFSPLKSDIAGVTDDVSSEGPVTLPEIDTKICPVPKKRTIIFEPLDSPYDQGNPLSRWGNWWDPRSKVAAHSGPLQNNTSWSSNDSGLPYEGTSGRLQLSGDHPSLPCAIAPEQESAEKGVEGKNLDGAPYSKQAGFGLSNAVQAPNLPEGREFGDRDFLILDHPTPLDEERAEVDAGTSCEKNDVGNGLSFSLDRAVYGQPPEEERRPSDASRTLKDSPKFESKFGWMSHTKFPPGNRLPPEPQYHRWTGGRAEVGADEANAGRGAPAAGCEDVGLPHYPVGQNNTETESRLLQVSYLPSSMDEKPLYGGLGSYGAPPMPELHSPEQGDSIIKVLEWFSRSTDSLDEDVSQQDAELKDQPGAPEDDITKHKMVEDKDRPIVPKDDVTTVNQRAECTFDGSSNAEMQVSHLKRAQLGAKVEEKHITSVDCNDKTQSQSEQEETCSESAQEDPIILHHSSLNTETAYQPKQRMSTVDTRPQIQKKENSTDTKAERDKKAKPVLLSPVSEAPQLDVKQSETRNERPPQRVTNLKSFWGIENSGPKVPKNSRSSAISKHNEIEPVNQTDIAAVSADEALPVESSHVVESSEDKYIAKCVDVDEDMEIPISPAEGKTDLQKSPQKEDSTLVELSSSIPTVRQSPNQLDDSADKIKNLKAFWESEKHGPTIKTGKLKQESADTKESQLPAPPADINKNASRSAFDLRMMANDNDYSTSPIKEGPNFTVISMKQRMEKSSMDQSPGSSQFKTLRDFWGGTLQSNGQTPQLRPTQRMSHGPKTPQPKGQESSLNVPEKSLSPTGDKKPYINPNYYPILPSTDQEMADVRAQREEYSPETDTSEISSPMSEHKDNRQLSPSPPPSQESGSSDEMSVPRSSDISPSTEIKRTQAQQRPAGKEQPYSPSHPSSESGSDRTPLTKDRHSNNTSWENTAWRESLSDEQQDISPDRSGNAQEEQPGGDQLLGKDAPEIGLSWRLNGGERPQPLARSILPRDFSHYLGTPEGPTFQSMPAAEKEAEEAGGSFPLEAELSAQSEPVRSSTPVVSAEPQGQWGSKEQDPWLANLGTDDLDSWYYRDRTHDTWLYSGTSSACNEEYTNSVRVVLERSKRRPVQSFKSTEDITSLSKREEEEMNNSRCDSVLSMDDVSVIPPSPPPFTSDLSQMKSMSKSVPFLLKESGARDSDSASEGSFRVGRHARMGSSLTNLSGSSGLSSVSGSVLSVYSGDYGSVEARGIIQFSISYVQKLKEFHIFVVHCRDLAVADPEKNRSNPYVKSYLIPDHARLGKRKTSVKKKTLDPNFNEILRYRVRFETLRTQMLNLSVWHNDTFKRNIFLGEVEIDLSKWDFGQHHLNNFSLKPRMQSGVVASDYRGEMKLALRFLPEMPHSTKSSSTGEVHIWVKECKDLAVIRGTSVNPFVKCFVLPDTSRKSRQKTRILKRTQNPAFNHTMVYDGFRTEDLPEACVELTVWDYDHIASHIVGGLRLGLGTGKSYGAEVGWMDSTAEEANLWERMMDSPNEWVEDMLPLRMLTVAQKQ